MRRLVPFLLLAMLLGSVALAPTAVADEEDEDDPSDRGRGRGQDDGRPSARPPAPIGTFQVQQSARAASGDYVSFSYDDEGVRDFTAGGTRLFNLSVQPDPEEDGEDRPAQARIAAHGSELRLETPLFRFVAHDNPTAVSRVSADGAIMLAFAEGAQLTPQGDERAAFSVNGLTGTLRGDNLVIDGLTVTLDEHALVFLDKPRGSFDVHRRDLSDAIANGSIGAEATFNQLAEGVQQDVVSYGNVTMTTMKAEQGNLTLLIDGHGFDGRVLVLNVDGRVLGASQADHLEILFDNETILHADGLADVLDPDNDGLQAEYYVVFDPQIEAFQLIVSVPHYSVHVLSVTTAIMLPPPSVVIGVAAGLLVLVPSAFVLFRRK